MRSLQEKVARVYFTHGLICASHPFVILVSVCSVILLLCYPLLYMPLPGDVPVEFVTPVKGFKTPPERYSRRHRSADSPELPRWYAGPAVGYIQQIVVKATVSPWQPEDHEPIDALTAPVGKVFNILEELNKFRYLNESEDRSLVDVCLRVAEPVYAKPSDGLLPEYSCLILSPANFWKRDQKRYTEDKEPLRTLYKRYSQALEAPPGIRDVLFGIPWTKTGISRYFIRNKQRTISFGITLVFKSFDERFVYSLRQKLESVFPDTMTHVNNSQIDYIVNIHYKNVNIYFEYIHLIVLYFVILLYLYFSVKKIEMVKSKWGLALSAVITVVASLCISVSLCSQLGLTSRLNGGEIFPYLVVLIGVENVVVITKSVVSTSIELDVSHRVASGLSKEGWHITKNLMIELAIVLVGFLTFEPAIQEFCLIALVGLLSDFFLQMFFFLTTLSIDIRRMELSDLQKFKHTSPPPDEHANLEPLLHCPFKTHHHRGTRPKFVSHLNLSSGMSMITSKTAPTSPRVQHEPKFFERPGLLEIPRRLRFIYFWANARVMQRIIMVCTVIWIALIVYKTGLVHHLTNTTYIGNDTEALEQIIKQEVLKVEPGSSDQVKVTDEAPLAFLWRQDRDKPGSVDHTDVETWRTLSHTHWITLFGYYNISIYGKYISILPTIHLSSIIPPEEAIKFRKPDWKPRRPPDTTPQQFPREPEATISVPEIKLVEKDQKDLDEEHDAHRNNKAEFDSFSEEYLRKYYPFVDPEHIQQILKYYPRSRQEIVITVCLGVLSVICISYFVMALYRCMCSKKYSKWRASWSKSARKGKMNNYIKQIKDSLPIVLKGHLQEIECLVTEGSVIVSCCLGGQIRVWDSLNGECLHVMQRRSLTPPLKRKVEGRNIEDSDADLYAEYHGNDSTLSDDPDQSSCHDNSSGVRHRVTFSCQPDNQSERNKYEHHPDLSSTIETNFTSIYQQKQLAGQKTNLGQGQGSKNPDTAKTDANNDTVLNSPSVNTVLNSPSVNTNSGAEKLNNSAETGFDFRTKFDELYREQRHIVEDGRRRESEKRRSQERQLMNESLVNRSKSWSEGDCSSTSEGSFAEREAGPASIWCITCKGNLIVAGCGNGRIEFWDASTGILKCVYGEIEIGVTNVNFVGKRVIVARLDGSIDFLELETFQDPKVSTPLSPSSLNRKIKGHSRHLSHTRTGSDDRHLWNEIIHCTQVQRSNAHSRPITVLQTEGGRIVSGSQDFTLKVFRLEDYSCLYTLHGHTGSITALYLDKCPPYAAVSGSADGSIRLWDLLTGHCVHKVKGHDGAIVSLTCTDIYIISSGLDDKLCVWERKRGHLLYSVDMETSCGSAIAMLNNNFLVTGGEGCLYLWDVHKGELVRVVNLQDREKTAFIHHIQAMENSTIVCDFGSEIKVIHFPMVLEKVD